jgi:hypothetical protein
MDAPPSLTEREVEYFLRFVERSLAVRNRHHFFLWVRGELQALLPHALVICAKRDLYAIEDGLLGQAGGVSDRRRCAGPRLSRPRRRRLPPPAPGFGAPRARQFRRPRRARDCNAATMPR